MFASDDDRRARRLALLARAGVVLVVLWVLALLAGALGLGRLPGVPLPAVGKISQGADAPATQHRPKAPADTSATPTFLAPRSEAATRPSTAGTRHDTAAARRRSDASRPQSGTRSRPNRRPASTAPATPAPAATRPPQANGNATPTRRRPTTPPGQDPTAVPPGSTKRQAPAKAKATGPSPTAVEKSRRWDDTTG